MSAKGVESLEYTPALASTGKPGNDIMGFSVVFFLGHFQTNCFYFIFYQFYCLAGMNHGAEYFFLSATTSLRSL